MVRRGRRPPTERRERSSEILENEFRKIDSSPPISPTDKKNPRKKPSLEEIVDDLNDDEPKK